MDNYDELLDCLFGFGKTIFEKGPSSTLIENIKLNKEYICLVKSGFTHMLNGISTKNISWASEIIYYMINHPKITQHEIQEILLMEEVIGLLQNGPVEQLSTILHCYGSSDLIMKYSEWLNCFIKSYNNSYSEQKTSEVELSLFINTDAQDGIA